MKRVDVLVGATYHKNETIFSHIDDLKGVKADADGQRHPDHRDIPAGELPQILRKKTLSDAKNDITGLNSKVSELKDEAKKAKENNQEEAAKTGSGKNLKNQKTNGKEEIKEETDEQLEAGLTILENAIKACM